MLSQGWLSVQPKIADAFWFYKLHVLFEKLTRKARGVAIHLETHLEPQVDSPQWVNTTLCSVPDSFLSAQQAKLPLLVIWYFFG
ncbi:hypothetical protein H671_3g11142 [Cricetulus griseus]|nr:hypothetical protein H671_3g11142 [Cricetulus griseus]